MRKRQLYERISMHEFGPDGRHAFEALLGERQGEPLPVGEETLVKLAGSSVVV